MDDTTLAAYHRLRQTATTNPLDRRQTYEEVRRALATTTYTGECAGHGLTIDELLGSDDQAMGDA